MSMDIVVWAACALSAPSDLPEPNKWKNYGESEWVYETSSWQVLFESSEDSKAPSLVTEINPEAKNSIGLVLAPIGAEPKGYEFLNTVAVAIAKKCGGAILQGPMGLVVLDKNGVEEK